MVAMRARQRDRFGGIRWGSAFFGLLSAIGLAAILLGIAAAAGVAIGVSEINDVRTRQRRHHRPGRRDPRARDPRALVVLRRLCRRAHGALRRRRARASASGCGRSSIGAALAIAAVIGGSEYDVLQQLNLPNVAVGDQSLTTTGLITLAAALVVTLLFAVLGGKAGDLFHRRVDRFATRDYVETA